MGLHQISEILWILFNKLWFIHRSLNMVPIFKKHNHLWWWDVRVFRGIFWTPRWVLTGVVGAFPVLSGPFLFIGTRAVEPIVWLLPWIHVLFSQMAACQGRQKMITQSKMFPTVEYMHTTSQSWRRGLLFLSKTDRSHVKKACLNGTSRGQNDQRIK